MTITVSALLTTMLVSVVLPALVGLLTKVSAPTWVKQVVSAALSAATGLITTATQSDGSAVISKTALTLALISFAASQVAYLSTYKPHDANSKLAPQAGLG